MKKIVLASFLFVALSVHAQTVDNQQFNFGYVVSGELQSLNFGMFSEQAAGPYITAKHPGFGAGAGIWGRWQLLPLLHVRPAFQFWYTENTLRFWSDDGRVTDRRYPFAELEFPLHFLLSSELKRIPVKGLVLFGGRLSWNLAASPSNAELKLLPERLGIDLGIGAGFTWGDWAIQPELVYSYGMNNVHDFTNSPYDLSAGRILRDRLSLRVVFGRQP